MKNEVYDVAIVGCGVCGANIARRLSAYNLKTIVLEAAADISFGVSKANSGIVHGGFHHNKKYLKARLEVRGSLLFDELERELHFPFKRCGIVVAALHEDEMKTVEHLYMQGMENGSIGIELCSRERLLELEPSLSPDVLGGLYAPTGGIVEPYRFVFSLMESAKKNGVELRTHFKVQNASWNKDTGTWDISGIVRDGSTCTISARYAVNSAGLYADDVSRMFGAEDFTITPRKGEYYLLDRLTEARPKRPIFPVPSPISKGMLVIPTVEGTVLIGPTAEDGQDKTDFSTTSGELEQVLQSAKRLVPGLKPSDIITNFAGLRPVHEEDFIIGPSKLSPHLIQVSGIQSPGLTASPAIGEYVKDLLKKEGLVLSEKLDYDPNISEIPHIRDCSPSQIDELISTKGREWGNVVCRCEEVSEAEIVEAIRQGHTTLDGIKYFTRCGMGRCQGGFCTYKIIKILMRETGCSFEDITKHGQASTGEALGSRLLLGVL
ncbi:MAG: FAD-dependent oxidoreductase [Spirochaetaceae bacterium]|jgi:glycerol-3-phosphate dehydrogenase|nr:FAD-dependent oxidoreductase [Spirochaetaceae bacterium]